MQPLRLTNWPLRVFGVMVVPQPYSSAMMLRECANVNEVQHPARGGNTERWLRQVADLAEGGG